MTTEVTTPAPTGAGQKSLGTTAARGFAVISVQAALSRMLSLIGFIVLARLLSPHDYGLAALANVFVIFFSTFASAGYSQALVQRKSVDKLDLDTVFCLGLATAALLTVVMFLASWPLADVFHTPQLRPVLQVLAPSFLFIAAGSVHQAVLQRRFAFRRLAARTLIADIISTAVGIAFALSGFGVWSLVIQSLLGVALNSIGCMAQSGYRPSLSVSLERFWPLFRTSRMFLGTMLSAFFDQRTDDFLIGSTIGVSALGIYTIGYRVLSILLQVLTLSASRVVFPIFSHIQNQPQRLRRAYLSVVRACTALVFPIFLFMFAAAPEITDALFGHRWAKSVPVMRILALYGPMSLLQLLGAAVLQGVGRARFVFRFAVCSTMVQVAAFAIAVNFGIYWVAASFVIRAYLVVPILLREVCRELGVSPWKLIRTIAPAAISSVVMAGAVLGVGSALPTMSVYLQLPILVGAGAVTYVGVLAVIGRETLHETVTYVWGVMGRRRGAAPPGVSAPAVVATD